MSDKLVQFPRSRRSLEALTHEYLDIDTLPDGPDKERLKREWLADTAPRALDELRKLLSGHRL